MKSLRILYIDDDSAEFTALANAFKQYVSLNEDLEPKTDKGIVKYQINQNTIFCVKNSANAIKLIQDTCFDLAFIDFKLSGEEGDEVGKHTYQIHYEIHQKTIYQVMLTAYQDKLINTLRAGVFRDFLSKPLNDNTAFAGILARYEAFKEQEKKRIEAEERAEKAEAKVIEQNSLITDLQKDFNVDISLFTDDKSTLKGNSDKMKNIRWFVQVFAESKEKLPILLIGETGTGKELVAYEIHKNSSRKSNSYVTINCSAIPHELIESELFGHVKGSFTGATKDHVGAFKRANLGTLFLDEFADLSISAQVKILRAIETGEIIPVGSGKAERVDVKIICATSQDFSQLITNKFFRSDLLHRVNSLFPKMPPLREHKEDIFDVLYYEFKDINPSPLTPDAIKTIIDFDYNWPGNIRELLSFIKNIRAMFSSSRFDKNKISMLLELWKTHQADIGLANEFYNGKSVNHTKPINYLPQVSNSIKADDGLTPDEIYLIPEVEKELKEYESVYNTLLLDWVKDTSSEPPKLEDVSKKFRNNSISSNYIRERFTGNGKINIKRKNVAKHLFANSFSEFKIRVLPPFDKLK